ncbi:MAG: hypothetical protein ABTQ34_03275 [Bdellovibrionales bacterium]
MTLVLPQHFSNSSHAVSIVYISNNISKNNHFIFLNHVLPRVFGDGVVVRSFLLGGMYMSLWDKPIFREFAAAGRLVNEWRDTLYYSGAVAFAGRAAYPQIGFSGAAVVAGTAVAVREVLRAKMWHVEEKRMSEFNDMNSLYHEEIYSLRKRSALCIGTVMLGALGPCLGFPVHGGLAIAACIFLTPSGGLRTIRDMYVGRPNFPGMWDYPRHDPTRGPTQTSKIKQWLKQKMH